MHFAVHNNMARSRRSHATRRSFRAYGWIPDLPDQRDYLFSARLRVPPELPEHADLRPFCSRVENQGAPGSRTAQALTGALEVLEKKETVGYDSGATARDGIKSLAREGVCAERRWPYVIARFKKKPDAAYYQEGAARQITLYHRLLTSDEMQACLAEGCPFVLGGHAVLAVGYSLPEKRFLVRNSRGTRRGQRGYFTLPFAYLEDRSLPDDF
jgi:C1A family cysteine protease